MSTKTLKVRDMPPMLKDACLERGHSLDREFSPQDAVAEWAAWELGDGTWAYDMIGLYALAVAVAKDKPNAPS